MCSIVLALLTGGALHLKPSFVVFIGLALVLFILIYHRLDTGLILTLFWAPFFLFPVSLHSFAIPMVEVMILLTAAAGFSKLMVHLGTQLQMSNSRYPLLSKESFKSITMMDLAVFSLAALALLSLFWTRNPDPARTELRTLIAEPLLFYLLLRIARPNTRTLVMLAATLILAGVIVSVYGLYLYFIGDSAIIAEDGARRLHSIYGSPNNVGLLLGRTIPFALAFVFVSVERRWRWLAAGSLLVMSPALILTQSVGAIALGVPAGIGLVCIGRFRRKALMPLIILAVIGVVGFAILTQVSARFANVLDFSSGTNFVRLRVWESTIAMLHEYPLTGIGMDQFLYHYGGEFLLPDVIWNAELSHPHNFILDFWTRLSVLGLAAFALIQLVFWRGARSVMRVFRERDPSLFAITLGLIGSMAALLAHGMIDNSVFVIDLAFIFMFQLAAMMRLREMSGATAS